MCHQARLMSVRNGYNTSSIVHWALADLHVDARRNFSPRHGSVLYWMFSQGMSILPCQKPHKICPFICGDYLDLNSLWLSGPPSRQCQPAWSKDVKWYHCYLLLFISIHIIFKHMTSRQKTWSTAWHNKNMEVLKNSHDNNTVPNCLTFTINCFHLTVRTAIKAGYIILTILNSCKAKPVYNNKDAILFLPYTI
jgi:hypothetical protein